MHWLEGAANDLTTPSSPSCTAPQPDMIRLGQTLFYAVFKNCYVH